jgi:hypothetical protein
MRRLLLLVPSNVSRLGARIVLGAMVSNHSEGANPANAAGNRSGFEVGVFPVRGCDPNHSAHGCWSKLDGTSTLPANGANPSESISMSRGLSDELRFEPLPITIVP